MRPWMMRRRAGSDLFAVKSPPVGVVGGELCLISAADKTALKRPLGKARKTLYVHRPVLNADEVRAWAKEQGFASTIPDLHVTIAYSKEPVDWSRVELDASTVELPVEAASMRQFGDAVVLALGSAPGLHARWRALRDAGASWDFDDYRPHVTITYDAGGLDLDGVEPYEGDLVLGPEVRAEVIEGGFDPDSIEEVVLKAFYALYGKTYDPNQPRVPRGAPDGGRWTRERGGIIAYHGTREKYLDMIMEEGITASRDRRRYPDTMYKGKRGEAVFVASSPEDALVYATNRFGDVRGRGVLLKLKIPEAEFARFKRDAFHIPDGFTGFAGPARYITLRIPSKWIEDAWPVDSRTGKIIEKVDGVAWVCVVLLSDPTDDAQLWAPQRQV